MGDMVFGDAMLTPDADYDTLEISRIIALENLIPQYSHLIPAILANLSLFRNAESSEDIAEALDVSKAYGYDIAGINFTVIEVWIHLLENALISSGFLKELISATNLQSEFLEDEDILDFTNLAPVKITSEVVLIRVT